MPRLPARMVPALTRLTERILKLMGKSTNGFTCSSVAELLNVKYPISLRSLHILEGIGLLVKKSKQYVFNTKRHHLPILEENLMVHQRDRKSTRLNSSHL